MICLENVEEFRDWCPLGADDRPIADKRGETFERWKRQLRKLGYRIEHRELRASDYGAPTIRKRLFLIARCDGRPIVWPAPTHGDPNSEAVKAGARAPWRTAADIIDWSLPCPSIFLTREEGRAIGVNRPLADATMARIAKGVKRYVLGAGEPFIIRHFGQSVGSAIDMPIGTVTAGGGGKCSLVAAHLTKFSENSIGVRPDEPLHTVMAGAPRHGIVAAFLAQHNTGVVGHDARAPVSTVTGTGSHQAVVAASFLSHQYSSSPHGGEGGLDKPIKTVTATGNHAAEVRAFLIKYYGAGVGQTADEPLHTVPTRDRFGLVTVRGQLYEIANIGMRMLKPRELFRAQGFPDSYVIDRRPDGSALTATASVRMCGNSVSPVMARALVAANYIPDEIVPPAEEAVLPLFPMAAE